MKKKYLPFKEFWNQYTNSVADDRLKLMFYVASDGMTSDDIVNFKPYHVNHSDANQLCMSWDIAYDYDNGSIKFKNTNQDVIIYGESILRQVNQLRKLHNMEEICYCYTYHVIEDVIGHTFTTVLHINPSDDEIKLKDPTPINIMNSLMTMEFKVNPMNSVIQDVSMINEKEIDKVDEYYKKAINIMPFKMDIMVGIYKKNKLENTIALIKDIDVKLDTDAGYVLCMKSAILDGRKLIEDYNKIMKPNTNKKTKYGYMYKIKTYPCNNQVFSFICDTKCYLQANGQIVLRKGPLDLMPMF